MISARIEHDKFLQGVHVVIVDELHAFAGDDRGWHLMFLLARLERLTGRRLQRIGLTATVGNPAELLNWFAVGRGGRVIGTRDPASSGDVTADHVGSVHNAITVITRLHRGERRLVFADTRTRVEEVAAGAPRRRRKNVRVARLAILRRAATSRSRLCRGAGLRHRLYVDARAWHRRWRSRPRHPGRRTARRCVVPSAHGTHRPEKRDLKELPLSRDRR